MSTKNFGGIGGSALLFLAVASTASASIAGAAYTTFDENLGGCMDSPNGVNCNHYAGKEYVYINGGPSHGGWHLSDGDYFFAVVTPGEQNGGFVDGANGNLSDVVAGGTAGDVGIGDDVSNRTFTVSGGEVYYTGTHTMGTAPGGRPIIGLAPFDDTDNPGGVYVVAVCAVGATSPSDCKYDAFKVDQGDEDVLPTIEGMKYYDANTNGQYDAGEVGIANWQLAVEDGVDQYPTTEADGSFLLTVVPDTYTVSEYVGGGTWMQTGNLVDQTGVTGGATATLASDKTYMASVDMNQSVDGLYFGNVCTGAGGGLTLGFWSNKNGSAVMKSTDNYAGAFSMLSGLNLVNANGTAFDPSNYTNFRNWLLNATATNMAYMLSAQLTAMELNVRFGYVDGNQLILATGATGANANGFMTVNALMAEANASLAANPYTVSSGTVRSYQEALKNALDNGNNNRGFVQAGPASCPTPVF